MANIISVSEGLVCGFLNKVRRKIIFSLTLVLITTFSQGEEVNMLKSADTTSASAAQKRIPVILDTDIGDDIDDTWALGLLLKSPEFDIKLVVGDYGKPLYRAKIIAKMLEVAKRTDVPVGMGIDINVFGGGGQSEWVKDYNINKYPGKVYPDGVQAMIDIIMSSSQPVTLICIGPLPNIAEALRRQPRIAERARFVGMHGSVRSGYGGSKDISAEWNVKADVKSAQKVFSAPWQMLITPLDTCGLVNLSGERYRKVRDSKDPIAAAIIENYRAWSSDKNAPNERSSTLFDTVAVYLALSQELVKIERLAIKVDDKGFTRIDENGKQIDVATEWKSLDGFRDFLVKRLTE